MIAEEDEDAGWDSDDTADATPAMHSSPLDIHDVPQCFSHFSHVATAGKKLVCDLQGTWNATDGFMLTDPVVHSIGAAGQRHYNGATDKGARGILSFFETHKCGPTCRRLGLAPPNMEKLRAGAIEETERMCVVCLSEPRYVRFGPCKHSACCLSCANSLQVGGHPCPLCRTPITAILVDILEQGQHVGKQRRSLDRVNEGCSARSLDTVNLGGRSAWGDDDHECVDRAAGNS